MRPVTEFGDTAYLYELFDTDAGPIVTFLERLRRRYAIGDAPAVLDVGCGPGRLLPVLHECGWRVTGMEPDEAYRARARRLAGPLGVDVLAGGFEDIAARDRFDMILGINGSFAHVLSPADRLTALARCRAALRAGGLLVLDLPNLLRVLREYRQPEERRVEADGHVVRLARRHDIDYAAATFTTHETYTVTAPDGGESVGEKEHVYAITAWPDLEHLLRTAGFRHIETWSAVTDAAPTPPDGARLIIAAKATDES